MKGLFAVIFTMVILSTATATAADKPRKLNNRGLVLIAKHGTKPTRPSSSLIKGNYWALIIGINNYEYWPKLDTAVKDAKSVSEVIQAKYGFSKDRVFELYDKEATRKNILKKLGSIAKLVNKNDSVFIYYAGHGDLDETIKTGYWIPSDAEINSPENYIANSTIRDYIGGMETKHTFLVSDSCFSGTFFGTQRSKPPTVQGDRYFEEAYSRRSRVGLTSGGAETVSDGGYSGHSIFNYYFLQSLTENQNRYITSGSIFERLKIAVANNSSQTPVYKPLKDAKDEGGEFIFQIADTNSNQTIASINFEENSVDIAKEHSKLAEEKQLLEEQKKLFMEKKKFEEDKARLEQEMKLKEEASMVQVKKMDPELGHETRNKKNIALGKKAYQSSNDFGGDASLVVDGNTSGNWSPFGASEVTHTKNEFQPWWQVDLEEVSDIHSIRVWNRTDCCSDRLSDFYVLVSNKPFAHSTLDDILDRPDVWRYFHKGRASTRTNVKVGSRGKYVRIQLSDSNYLSLAEVEVFGVAAKKQ